LISTPITVTATHGTFGHVAAIASTTNPPKAASVTPKLTARAPSQNPSLR
jgi:hypothetical protein